MKEGYAIIMNQSENEAIAKAVKALKEARRRAVEADIRTKAAEERLVEEQVMSGFWEGRALHVESEFEIAAKRIASAEERLVEEQVMSGFWEGRALHVESELEIAAKRIASAEARVIKLQEDRKRLDRRIHNQRRALRINREISETRSGSHRPWPREVRSNFLKHWTEDARRRKAAEARVKELEGELDTIVRGRYDGLEVTHYSADECRNIARAALRR
jgi:hypothetical protein